MSRGDGDLETTAASPRRLVFALLLALGITLLIVAARGEDHAAAQTTSSTPTTSVAGTAARDQEMKDGQALYLTSCVSCHGVAGVGTINGPALFAAGEASASFMLRTGRMPLAAPAPQPPQKAPAYTDDQIRALVTYVGSLCDTTRSNCPPIPDVDTSRGDLQAGGALFLANCAPCHNSVAVGGALSDGNEAPSLQQTPTLQVGEAIRTGPGDMPEFGHDVFTDQQVDSIVKYVEYLREPEHPGGLSLGFTGPVAEGFVALLLGLGTLVFAIRWITREPPEDDEGAAPATPPRVAVAGGDDA